MLGIWIAFRVLRCEPLVGMFMAGQNQVGMRVVQVLPECPQFRMLCVLREQAAAEQCVVPVGKDAGIRVRGQILL